MSSNPNTSARLEGGRRPTAARAAWIAFALILTALQVASQVAAFRQSHTPVLTPTQLQGLHAMGLNIGFYGLWKFVLQLPNPLLWSGLGLLIFWRRSADRGALVVSAMMVGIGMAASIPAWQAFVAAYPGWVWLVPIAALIGNVCINSFFFVFPTGRYVPRWTVGLAVALAMFNVLNSYDFALPASLVLLGKNLSWAFPLFIVAAIGGYILGPVYRYRVSTPLERQQIKFVVFTIILAMALFAAAASTAFLVPGGDQNKDISFVTVFVQPIGWLAALQLIPIAIMLSILRYRLFDIDLIVRRTLVYSALTALLALVYFGSVVLLQRLVGALTGAEQSSLAVVVSTLVIAALFAPLRRRIQDGIDRRFFRKKYDAQQVLAQFAVTARDETDLDALTGELARVVQETLQPEGVSVWLRETGRDS